MKKIKLENEKEILKILKHFFQLLIDNGNISIEGYLDDKNYEIDKKDDPLRIIYKNKFIRDHYSTELLSEILDVLYQHYFLNRNVDLIKTLYELFQKSYTDWLVVFPIEYSKRFTKENKSKTYKINDFLLTTSLKSKKEFVKFISNEYKFKFKDLGSFEHIIRTAGEYILNEKLLVGRLHGDRLVVRAKGYYFFRIFKSLNELFIARYSKKEFYNTLLEENCEHFFLVNLKKGDIERRILQDGSRIKWFFDDKLFKLFLNNNFNLYLEYILLRNDKMINRLNNALKFFSKGFNENDKLTRFVFYVISMESIFSRDKNNPIKVTLADNISLLCYKENERLQIHKKIREIYDKRSGIVHSGDINVNDDLVNEAEVIASQAILASLNLYVNIKEKRDAENIFFNHLLNLKLIK